LFEVGAASVINLESHDVEGQWVLVPVDPGKQASLRYGFSGPYPYLAGSVHLAGTIGEGGALRLEFGDDDGRWTKIWQRDAPGAVQVDVPTTGYFRNGYGEPMYRYALRLTLESSTQGMTLVRGLEFTSDIQHAPRSLPSLRAGRNEIRWRQAPGGPAPADVEVAFGYDVTLPDGGTSPDPRIVGEQPSAVPD
jgi:hypothetical protein